MKINVEFLGMPMIYDITGKKRLEIDVSGETVKDVIDELIKCYGKKMRDAFYDAEGTFDTMIQITLNGESLTLLEKNNTPLDNDDTVTFMLLLAGG